MTEHSTSFGVGSVVLQLRGTSGSGKSTIVRNLLDDPRGRWQEDHGHHLTIRGKKPTLLGYRSYGWNMAVVGPYRTACGGCDAVPTQDEIKQRVYAYLGQGYTGVVFEGLLAAHLRSRYEGMARELRELGVEMYGLFLGTPLDECLRRVQARRAAAGNLKPLNPTNTVAKWHDITRRQVELKQAGFHSEILPPGGEIARVRELLRLPEAEVAA